MQIRWLFPLFLAAASAAVLGARQEPVGYTDTPFLPGGKWRVHDANRPNPPVVHPGAQPGAAPSDATVLFDGKDLSAWQGGDGKPAGWKLVDGVMEVNGSGNIQTKAEFGDFQMHLEWAEPKEISESSQGRGNSGVFLMGRYEVQVLDCYDNRTYADGQTGALYGQKPPDVNACRAPGEWQSYDIVFHAPHFDGEKLASPARVTVFQNGIVVQDDIAFLGTTGHRTLAQYSPHPPQGPIVLQDHGNPVRYRNIWIRPLTPLP